MSPKFDPASIVALFAVYSGLIIGAIVVGLLIAAAILYMVYKLYLAVPADKREMDPVKVWFLLIPCVPLVFNFWVFPGLARSIRAAVTAKGGTMDDTLEKLGLWYSIASVCCIIPCVNYLAGPTALVLFILFMVKGYEQKKNMA
jgi:hypothetical protein